MEEPGGVDAVGDGAPDDGEPVEDNRRLVGVLEQQLLGDVDKDGHRERDGEHDNDLQEDAQLRKVLGQRPGQFLEDAHRCERRRRSKVQAGLRTERKDVGGSSDSLKGGNRAWEAIAV